MIFFKYAFFSDLLTRLMSSQYNVNSFAESVPRHLFNTIFLYWLIRVKSALLLLSVASGNCFPIVRSVKFRIKIIKSPKSKSVDFGWSPVNTKKKELNYCHSLNISNFMRDFQFWILIGVRYFLWFYFFLNKYKALNVDLTKRYDNVYCYEHFYVAFND